MRPIRQLASVIGAVALVLGGLIYLLTGDISIPVFAWL